MRRLPISLLALDPQIEDPSYVPEPMSPMTLNGKRGWKASLFDRLVPQGDSSLSDADKSRMTSMGLLQLAAGLQSSPNFGEALTKGLSGGLLAMNQGVDDIQNRAYKQQLLQSRLQDPTEFRALDMQVQAAGYKPGTPEYQHAMRVALKTESGASSAAIQYKTVVGPDGRPQIVAVDPNKVGAEVVGTGDLYGGGVQPKALPAPMSGAGADVMGNAIQSVESAGNPNAVSPVGARGLMQLMPATAREIEQHLGMPAGLTDRDPEANRKAGEFYYQQQLQRFGDPRLALAAYNGGPNRLAGHLQAVGGNPDAALARMPAETRAYVPKVMARAGNPFVGQSPAEKAASEDQAKVDVQVGNAGRVAGAEAQVAAAKAKAEADAKAASDRANGIGSALDADKARTEKRARIAEAGDALSQIQSAANAIETLARSPGYKFLGTVKGDIARFAPHSTVRDAYETLDTIKSQGVVNTLAKLRSLSANGSSGFGSLTEGEAKMIQDSLANLSTAQSHKQIDQNLAKIAGVLKRNAQALHGRIRQETGGTSASRLSDDELISQYLGQ